MRLFWGLLCLLGICATLTAPLRAQESDVAGDREGWESWKKDTLQWFETLETGATARVVNRFGNIYTRFGGYENKMEILATVQTLDPERPDLEVRRSATEQGLDVTVEDPAPGHAGKRGRIDLVVFVPEGVSLEAETDTDLIEAKGLHSDVTLRSRTGDIRMRKVRGRVVASTERGTISASLETGVTQAPQELSTTTGEIEVHVWEDADLAVDVRTSGQITTDFTMQIEHRRFEEPGKHARAVIGEGASRLVLSSKRGPIKLLRLVRDYKRGE